jgi:hypothetical protein
VISFARILSAAALALALLAPTPALAGTDTLKRSIGNILFAPLDLVAAPFVAGKTVVNNLQNIDDTRAVQIAYAGPGVIWLTGVNAFSAVLREATGLIELVPGIALLPFPDTNMDPLFDPVERGEALVDYETPPLDIKFGVDYATPPS